jgi:hypothetical protein
MRKVGRAIDMAIIAPIGSMSIYCKKILFVFEVSKGVGRVNRNNCQSVPLASFPVPALFKCQGGCHA